ncbi:MAG: hypothetical protein H7Y37_02470 [Anaerolineae bacterium]|nr:hypothetical protein [Gloeobacterales cyanobacterium ES-bin-313]
MIGQSTDAPTVLRAYGFEMDESLLAQTLANWEDHYCREWLMLALVEALHQGRYKLMSVGQILVCWARRGEPRISFDRDFQRMVLAEDWQPIVTPLPLVLPILRSEERIPVVASRVELKLRALVGLAV